MAIYTRICRVFLQWSETESGSSSTTGVFRVAVDNASCPKALVSHSEKKSIFCIRGFFFFMYIQFLPAQSAVVYIWYKRDEEDWPICFEHNCRRILLFKTQWKPNWSPSITYNCRFYPRNNSILNSILNRNWEYDKNRKIMLLFRCHFRLMVRHSLAVIWTLLYY